MTLKIHPPITRTGAFVWLLCFTGGMIVFAMLLLGVNPTLVISVVAAPMWVIIILICWKLSAPVAKMLHDHRTRAD